MTKVQKHKMFQVFVSVDSHANALKISKHLVEKKLAACVQILGPMTSIYRWKNNIEEEQEFLCLIKTKRNLFDKLKKEIKSLHLYEVPEILALECSEVDNRYHSWLIDSLK